MKIFTAKKASVLAVFAMVLGSFTIAAPAQAAGPITFSWNTLRAGDCTMFQGATWTLYDNGQARFDGTVTSGDNNDAWLMWADIKDANGAILGTLTNNAIQNPADRREFIQNLPDRSQRYRWFAAGEFDRTKFSLIRRMSLRNSC